MAYVFNVVCVCNACKHLCLYVQYYQCAHACTHTCTRAHDTSCIYYTCMHAVYAQAWRDDPVAWELPHPAGARLTIASLEDFLPISGTLDKEPLAENMLGCKAGDHQALDLVPTSVCTICAHVMLQHAWWHTACVCTSRRLRVFLTCACAHTRTHACTRACAHIHAWQWAHIQHNV